jgi:LEA14-like dessication related protein
MRSNKWPIVIVLVLLIGAATFWWWKSPASEKVKEETASKILPSIGMAAVHITDIDAEKIKLLGEITLYNPLPVDMETEKLNYTIYIDSVKVIEDAYEKTIQIRSSDSSTLILPIQILATPLTQVIKYINTNDIDSAHFTIDASFMVKVPIAGTRAFNVNVTKKLPTLRIPKIKVKDINLNAFKLKSNGMDIELEVFNPNLYPIKMNNGKFEFIIEDAMHMGGVLEKHINIPGKESKLISMHAEFMEGKMLKTGWKILLDKKDTQFTCKFTGKLDSENKLLRESNISALITGTLDEIVNAAKKLD